MSGGVPASGVCEIALEMNDLEADERFYAGVLGFPVVERWSDRGGVHVRYAMHIAEPD